VSHVIVVGAGVIGCACAHALAHAGARVSVFDARKVGRGASQASAGVLAPFIEGHESSALRDLGRRSLELYDTFVQDVMAASGLTLQYTRSGTLEVALDRAQAIDAQRAVTALRGQGIDAQWFGVDDLRESEPLVAPTAAGATFIGTHGFVGVPDLTDALAASAMRAGATFALDARVVSIRRAADGRTIVETENGPSTADVVVLAAGSWAGQIPIEGIEPVKIAPVRGQLLHLAWPTAQPLRHVVWGPSCYLVPWLNGRVLVGATVEDVGFEERATASGVRGLLDAACELVPQLETASFAEVRVGLRPASPDALPVVGRSAHLPGLIYATGHYRNGVLLAPLTAALVKGLVLGSHGDPALDIISPARFGL
jgi:glycine oxidase